MSASYILAEYNEFEELVELTSSSDQCERIKGRLEMPKFIKKHGKAKCDAMYAELTKDD